MAAGIAASRAALAESDKNDAAQEKYEASPAGRKARAEQAGDVGGVRDAEYDEKVERLRPKLVKEEGYSEDGAEQEAQRRISADEEYKEREKDEKEEERIAKRAQAEADAWVEQNHKEEEAEAKEAADDAKKTAAATKKRADAIAGEKEQIAITQARASGNDALADKLEKQRDLQTEITRLMGQGLNYTEALDLATQKVNAQNDEQDRKDAAKKNKRSSGDDTIYGYSDPVHDASGKLHGGALDGGVSRDRFADQPDRVRVALDAAPDHVSSFIPPSFSDVAENILRGFRTGGNSFFAPGGFPSAAAGVAPAADSVTSNGTAGSATAGDSSLTTAAQGAKSAADGAASSAQSAAQSTQAAVNALQGLAGSIKTIQTGLATLDQRMQTAETAIANINTNT